MNELITPIGEDPAFLEMVEHLSRLAPLSKPTLVVGERGVGKELVAERLHFLSHRWDAPLVKLNCATLSDNLLESELFGHEAGAFTGAQKRHIGRFERADGGSLFLDEIATASQAVQEKILRVIEYGEFERIGGSEPIQIDVRVIGATNEDLPSLADEGKFRPDLLDRLAFDVITIPPLRHRPRDIPLLAETFGRNMAKAQGHALFPGFSQQMMEELLTHPWPGNVRELKNVVERAVYRSSPSEEPINEIQFDPFESPWRPTKKLQSERATPKQDTGVLKAPFKDSVAKFEKELLLAALKKCQFNQTETAKQLELSYHQLRRQLKKHDINNGESNT